jgi:hypothetical protein
MSRRARAVHLAACAFTAALLCAAPSEAGATTIAGGNVINQTWTPAGNPYLVQGDVTVPAGAFLTIEAGTIVQFASVDGQAAGIDTSRVELTVDGTLAVNGAVGSPVVFQAQSGTSADAWYGIVAGPGATSVSIQGAAIQHAALGITSFSSGSVLSVSNTEISATTYGVWVETGSPTITGLSVTGSGWGVYVGGSGAPAIANCLVVGNSLGGIYVNPTSGTPTTTVTGCTLHANGAYGVNVGGSGGTPNVVVKNSVITNHSSYAVYRSAGTCSVTYSTLWGNGADSGGSPTIGTGVVHCNPLYANPPSNLRLTSNSPARNSGDTGGDLGALPYVSDATPGLYGALWTDTTLPAGVSTAGGDLIVPAGVTLTMAPGATLQFPATGVPICTATYARGAVDVRGRLLADGTPAQPVVFTSTVPGKGAWNGLMLSFNTVPSSITWAKIENAWIGIDVHGNPSHVIAHTEISGSGYGFNVSLGNLTLDAVTVRDSDCGFNVGAVGGTITLSNCVARANAIAGIVVSTMFGALVNVRNCTLDANGTYGIHVGPTGTPTVNVVNSIVTNHTGYGLYRESGTINYSYSDVWGNGTNTFGATAGAGNLSQNPMYKGAPSDLTLQAGSVCIDAGTSVGAPDHDLLGGARPVDGDGIGGAQPDLGAYEYVPVDLCAGVVCAALDACQVAGVCNPATGTCAYTARPDGTACGDYACSGGLCPTSCSTGAQCAAGAYCEANACTPKLALGTACGGGAACASGWCVDGRCCNTGCTGQCESCNVAGLEGSCSPVSGPPVGSRTACTSDGSGCGGACDGTDRAACAYPTSSCGSASCDAGSNAATPSVLCDGQGHCPSASPVSCAPYTCGPSACRGDCAQDADCVSGDYCDAGLCKVRLADGTACAGANQCASGHCVDTVCCASACGGQCEACNEPGHAGSCVAAAGAPRGGRAACAGIGACQGSCDGANVAACTFPGGGTSCFPGDCASGKATAASTCDGAGSCAAGAESPCGAYACDLTACKTSCGSDADCSGGHSCTGGACVTTQAKKSGGGCDSSGEGGMAWLPIAVLALLLATRVGRRAVRSCPP